VTYKPETVLNFWFPNDGFWQTAESFSDWFQHRMHGGVDKDICQNFSELTIAAARSELDSWAETAEGRIALIIALDQFSRSLWRDTPAAYAQDIKANILALQGVKNDHFAAVAPWKKLFYLTALFHCEGPDHLQRFAVAERLTEIIIREMPDHLTHIAGSIRDQNARGRAVIERFGRHPHRNPHFGRVSSAEEEAYIATGDFPHAGKKS